MSRLLLVAVLGLLGVAPAAAQCLPWYPVYPPRPVHVYGPAYPLSPAIWGAPAPKPLPPAPAPFTPKPGVAVQEDEDLTVPRPADRPKEGPKPKSPDAKEKDAPRIPKVLLPGDPGELDPAILRPPAPKKGDATPEAPPRKEPVPDKGRAVEQFFIPAEGGRGEPKPEVKVGFFNHSDREIVLDVNGEAVKLPSEQYVTLRLPRTFKWAEKGQKATDVAVPADADGMEIVFRK